MKNLKLIILSCILFFNFHAQSDTSVSNLKYESPETILKSIQPQKTTISIERDFDSGFLPVPPPKKQLSPTPSVKLRTTRVINYDGTNLLTIANSYIGVPYVWASRDPNVGFDCSNYVSYVYGKIGVNIPAGSRYMQHYGELVEKQHARPGDIIFFDTKPVRNNVVAHVALIYAVEYVNDVQEITILHAYKGGITKAKLNNDKWLSSRVLFIKRIINDDRIGKTSL